MGTTNEPFDLSFLDERLNKFDHSEMQRNLDRIGSAFLEAFKSVDGETAYKDFWTDKTVDWRDTRAGISKLGSMLSEWLQREGVIDQFDAENHRYDPLPPKTKEFIQSTRIVLELAMALGAVLATRKDE